MADLRDWQEEALRKFVQSDEDFLCVATPGAGKTKFALVAFSTTDYKRLIIVAPSRNLREQWATKAKEYLGISIDHTFKNEYRAIRSDVKGIVVTYASVARNPNLYSRLCTEVPTLVVIDEIHHCGDHETLPWGAALKTAFIGAARRLSLSGTPFRTDGKDIPFVKRAADGYCDTTTCGHRYTYKEAYNDGVVRPAIFHWHTAPNAYLVDGELIENSSLQQAIEQGDQAVALKALHGTGDFAVSLLQQAHESLVQQRKYMPTAAGLVVARDITHAKLYKMYLDRLTKTDTPIVHSEEPEAGTTIRRFKDSRAPWLVSVKMVSEGVDIPRLTHLVYTSNILTRMFWEQVLGRIVRATGNDVRAVMFMPDLPELRAFAAEIEAAIKEIEALNPNRGQGGGGGNGSEPGPDKVPVNSGDAAMTGQTYGGGVFNGEEIEEAVVLRQKFDVPAWVQDAEVAKLIRGIRGETAPAAQPVTQAVSAGCITLDGDIHKALSKEINNKVFVLHKLTGKEKAAIHVWARNATGGNKVAVATVEELKARISLLNAAINEARNRGN